MGSRYQLGTLGALVVGLTLIAGAGAFDSAWSNTMPAIKNFGNKQIMEKAVKLQIPFAANQGQIKDQSVKFYARTFGGSLYVTEIGELIYAFPPARSPKSEVGGQRTETGGRKSEGGGQGPGVGDKKSERLVFKEILVGAKITGIEGADPSQAKVNYFIGNDKTKWKSNIPTFNKINLGEVYEGINLVLKAYGKTMEKIFTVNPGSDPKSIKLKIDGARSLKINDRGELEAEIGHGIVKLSKPIAFQEKNGKRENVQIAYSVGKNTYGFKAIGYDRSLPLVIDPMLIHSTYLGGALIDNALNIKVDSEGFIHVSGVTESGNFPISLNPYQDTLKGGLDIFVVKLSPGASALRYATYIGGSSNESAPGIAVDMLGNTYIAGSTGSSDFPTTIGALQPSSGGDYDAFITKLNSDGSGLIYSTYLGGSQQDMAMSIAVDAAGGACVTGRTFSQNFPIFPILTAYQKTNNGGGDIFVAKLNPDGTGLAYSTYLGGTGYEIGNAIVVDDSGIYIAGETDSTDFPLSLNPFQDGKNSGRDMFLTKLSTDGSTLVYSTYLGGGADDIGTDIAVDNDGNAYMVGYTYSDDLITAINACQDTYAGGGDIFVAKLNPNGTELPYSTYLGGTGADVFPRVAVDYQDKIFITGGTDSVDLPITSNAYQVGKATGEDAFVAKIDPTKTGIDQLRYSTYLGGTGDERGRGIALGTSSNEVYVAGETSSNNFPISNAYQASYGGGLKDAFVVKLWVGEFIDRTQWTNAEFIRRITNGELESVFTQYGASGDNCLSFLDYDALEGIKARVKVARLINEQAFVRVRLAGFWYQATFGDHIYSEIGIRPTTSGENPPLEVYYMVLRCADPTECADSDIIADAPICAAEPDNYYDLSIRWTGSQFAFGCDYLGGPDFSTLISESASYDPTVTYPPNTSPYFSPWKGIGTRVSGTGGDPGRGGYIAVFFDDVDVYLSGGTDFSTYDDFNAGMIDAINWREWERVRHAENGVYELALKQYDFNDSNYLFFADTETIKGFEADVTVTEVSSTGAFPSARLTGAFYNDGSIGDGSAGDVFATVALADDGAGGLRCYCWITKCIGGYCNLSGEYQTIYDYFFPTTLAFNTPYTLSVVWDETLNRFTFGLDEATHIADLSLPIAGPPILHKGIGTRVSGIDTYAEGAYISATFDNVVVLGGTLDWNLDTDNDGIANVFDEDDDNDGITDVMENEVGTDPLDNQNTPADADGDGTPDSLDNDADNDGILNNEDNCPDTFNPGQEDQELVPDGIGDACDTDADGDGHISFEFGGDDCYDWDPAQWEGACTEGSTEKPGSSTEEIPDDGDGINASQDNCPLIYNLGQQDRDNDGIGDLCDTCPDDPENDADHDGICGDIDNCPGVPNKEQDDLDGDGAGDVCDLDADGDGFGLDQGDLDDMDPSVYPGAPELADGKDNDCNGIIDDGTVAYYIDFSMVDYELWEPKPGGSAELTLQAKDSSGATTGFTVISPIRFTEVTATNYPGQYTNDPSDNTSPDFLIPSTISEVADGGSITLTCQDYGGSITFRAEVDVQRDDGDVFVARGTFTLPKDADRDGLADVLEMQKYNSLAALNAAEYDSDGDGLTNRAELRGFYWGPPLREISGSLTGTYQTTAYVPEAAVATHFRTDPLEKKDLFVKVQGYNFGSYNANCDCPFAIGRAFDDAGVDVHVLSLDDPPSFMTSGVLDWEKNISVLKVTNVLDRPYGISSGDISKVGIRDWKWSTKGWSLIGTTNADGVFVYGVDTSTFQIPLDRYFFQKPYKEDDSIGGNLTYLDWINQPTVEDKNDNGVIDKREAQLAGDPLKLEGDVLSYPVTFGNSHTALDIDNDGKVELPMGTDPAVPANGSYPNEYTRAQVLKHTITHEMGHSVGMIHTYDPTCVMYDISNNWERDNKFCDSAKTRLQIHNQ